jgi:hypothetical protein
MLQTTRIIREDITSDVVTEQLTHIDLHAAYENFWHFRTLMNPRLTLKKMWFPRSLAIKLRAFYDDFKAGKRPVMLLMNATAARQVAYCDRLHRLGGRARSRVARDLHQLQ